MKSAFSAFMLVLFFGPLGWLYVNIGLGLLMLILYPAIIYLAGFWFFLGFYALAPVGAVLVVESSKPAVTK